MENGAPVFDKNPKVKQGFIKKIGVLALPDQQQRMSLVKELSKQPHMLQFRSENDDRVTKVSAPQGPKLYAEQFEKMRGIDSVVSIQCSPKRNGLQHQTLGESKLF